MPKQNPPKKLDTPATEPVKEDPMDAVFRMNREQFYRAQSALFDADVKAACRRHDFLEVQHLFIDMARFLMRHPDSLETIK